MATYTYATGSYTTGENEEADYYNQEGGNIIEERIGGSLSWEANNPGDISAGSYATAEANLSYWDAIGVYTYDNLSNGETYYFYMFADTNTGLLQVEDILEGQYYKGSNLSIGGACLKYTGLSVGSTALSNYETEVLSYMGGGPLPPPS